jgi:hypothetical protein
MSVVDTPRSTGEFRPFEAVETRDEAVVFEPG